MKIVVMGYLKKCWIEIQGKYEENEYMKQNLEVRLPKLKRRKEREK